MVGALALPLVIALAAPGTAGTRRAGAKQCDPLALCVWAGENYKGQLVQIKKVGEVSNKLAKVMDNRASSVRNRWKHSSHLYRSEHGEGENFCFNPHSAAPDLSAFFDPFNNDASSALLDETTKPCV